MNRKEKYLKNIDELLSMLSGARDSVIFDEVYFRTITLIENLYGKEDKRIPNITKFKVERWDNTAKNDYYIGHIRPYLEGTLKGIRADIQNELITNLERQAVGSVVADFIALAKISASENIKDVAVILSSAALEDSLKRYAILNNLQVDDKDMSEVINALKAKGLLKGPQASIIASHTKTRNKAFHAEFDKIEMPEVQSLIAFTEAFILENLS